MKRTSAAALAIMITCATTAQAAATFTTNFSGSSLDANLTTYGPSSWTTNVAGTGALTGTPVLALTTGSNDPDRSYVQTTATDYNTANFTVRLTYSQSCCDSPTGLVFIGLGSPSPLDSNHEPGTGLFMRLHPGSYSYADGLVSRESGTGSNFGGFSIGAGLHTAKIVKTDNLLSFFMDAANNGTFVQFGSTLDLTTAPFAFLNNTNSRLFFGTGDTQPQFASLSITSSETVPEPASLAVISLALIGLAASKSRRLASTKPRDHATKDG